MKKIFQEISKTDLLFINGGGEDVYATTCHCWCQAVGELGGYVFELGEAVSAKDCANRCYRNAYSDYWDYYCKRK